MRFLITIARMYPGRSALTLVSLLFAGVADGLGLLFLLPLLNLATSDAARVSSNGLSGVGHMLTEALSAIGVTPTVGALLVVILVCLSLNAVFLILANVQVGYTVAHVATDLRLSLLRSLLAARWEFYVRQPVGSLTNAIGTEAIRAAQAYFQGVRTLVVLIQAIVYAGVAFFVTWKGALLSLGDGRDRPLWAAPARPYGASRRHAPDSTAQVSLDPFGRQPSIGKTSESDGA